MFQTKIKPIDLQVGREARERIDALTKPLGSLGRIEYLAERLAAIAGRLPLGTYERRAILLCAGDHGVCAQGVSAYPSDVTPQMVGAFLGGFAAINAFARAARAEVFVANLGVATPLPQHERLLDLCVGAGTRNFAREAAMSDDALTQALTAGAKAFSIVNERVAPQILALGEMGIGNTTSAAAMICGLTGATPEEIVGRGTGIDEAALARKRSAVAAGLARTNASDWRSIAREVGGYEIIGLSGVMLAAARARIPILLDGFIVAAAALLAQRLDPQVVGYFIAAHRSQELGHRLALRELGLAPLLDLDLRLGEGSGAALCFGLVEAAARMIDEMKTFEQAGVATATSA